MALPNTNDPLPERIINRCRLTAELYYFPRRWPRPGTAKHVNMMTLLHNRWADLETRHTLQQVDNVWQALSAHHLHLMQSEDGANEFQTNMWNEIQDYYNGPLGGEGTILSDIRLFMVRPAGQG